MGNDVRQLPLNLVSQISTGNNHTCAINTNNELYCWGYGDDGQLGLGNTNNQATPTRVGNATNWSQISTGLSHTCATNTNDELYCWGLGYDGQLGLGDTKSRATPEAVLLLPSWVRWLPSWLWPMFHRR